MLIISISNFATCKFFIQRRKRFDSVIDTVGVNHNANGIVCVVGDDEGKIDVGDWNAVNCSSHEDRVRDIKHGGGVAVFVINKALNVTMNDC